MRRRGSRRGAALGDLVLIAAATSLFAALLVPGLDGRARERGLEALFSEVESARVSAEGMHAASGTWPASDALPLPEPPDDVVLRYRMEWRRVALAELEPPSADAALEVPEDMGRDGGPALSPPRPSVDHVGILSVHAGDDATLQALLERYGAARSFVHDTVWSLVLPRTPEPSNPAS